VYLSQGSTPAAEAVLQRALTLVTPEAKTGLFRTALLSRSVCRCAYACRILLNSFVQTCSDGTATAAIAVPSESNVLSALRINVRLAKLYYFSKQYVPGTAPHCDRAVTCLH